MYGSDLIRIKLEVLMSALPAGEKKVAQYFLQNIDHIGELNLSTISSFSCTSQATIIRLCKRLGFDGFLEFRNFFRSVNDNSDSFEPEIGAKSTLFECLNLTIQENLQTMKNTLALYNDQYELAAEAIKNCNHLTMYGNGDAIIPCNLISMKLMKMGKPCSAFSDQDLQIFSAASLNAGDVAIAVSHTGHSSSVIEAMRISKQRGATTIAITSNQKSPLIKYCDIILFSGTVDNTIVKDKVARRISASLILESIYRYSFNSKIEYVENAQRGAQELAKMGKLIPEDYSDQPETGE